MDIDCPAPFSAGAGDDGRRTRRYRPSNPPRHTLVGARTDDRQIRRPRGEAPVVLVSSDTQQTQPPDETAAVVVVGVCPGDHLLLTRATGPQVALCAHFAANGECSRGRKCRFAHYVGPRLPRPTATSGSAEEDEDAVRPSSVQRPPAPHHSNPARAAPPTVHSTHPAGGTKAVVAVPGGGWQHAAYAARPVPRSPTV